MVPFGGSYLEFYKGTPKRNYFGAYIYGHDAHGAPERVPTPSDSEFKIIVKT